MKKTYEKLKLKRYGTVEEITLRRIGTRGRDFRNRRRQTSTQTGS